LSRPSALIEASASILRLRIQKNAVYEPLQDSDAPVRRTPWIAETAAAFDRALVLTQACTKSTQDWSVVPQPFKNVQHSTLFRLARMS